MSGIDVPSLLTPAEAARNILDVISPLPCESSSLPAALDRVLADEITSPIDVPHWDNSAMDGYAVISADVAGNCPVELPVVAELAAGDFPAVTLRRGSCVRIFTGAPIPDGADGVIRQEDADPLPGERVRINADRDAGGNVRRRGEDIRVGERLFERGTLLGPAQIGVLASAAHADVLVYRRPRVALLTSGDEIADLGDREAILDGRKVASSNTYTLTAAVQQAGAEAVQLGIAADDAGDLRTRLLKATEADILVTSGAVSVGEHDLMRRVLGDLGLQQRFWRIRMRPGAPVGFGLLQGIPWIGLPGNPVSTMVTFELFVRPALRRMLGHSQLFRRTFTVRTGEPIQTRAPLQHFLRVTLDTSEDGVCARLTGAQGSGILTSMARAEALLIVPAERQQIEEGETLDAFRLDEPVHVDRVPY